MRTNCLTLRPMMCLSCLLDFQASVSCLGNGFNLLFLSPVVPRRRRSLGQFRVLTLPCGPCGHQWSADPSTRHSGWNNRPLVSSPFRLILEGLPLRRTEISDESTL